MWRLTLMLFSRQLQTWWPYVYVQDQVHKLQLGQSYAADQTSPFFSSQPMLA